MKKAYYKALKSTSNKMYTEWEETQVEVQAHRCAIEKEFEVYSLYMRGNDSIVGLVLKGHGHERRGFKSENITEDGQKYTILKPKGTFKEAKRFKSMSAMYLRLVGEAPSFSNYVVNKLGLTSTICAPHPGGHGHAMYYATAGVAKDHAVLIVPHNDKYPLPDEIPQFDKIKKSEFIALTEE